ncbi:hypothetical protein QF028_002325 [Neobacillus sp. B4I6]|nr:MULTISPECIES: hypothetical protein [unclassified Bacillus (in: firmicutes)]
MDHIWNGLKEWESIWEEQLQADKNGPEHEHKQHNPVFPTSRTGY